MVSEVKQRSSATKPIPKKDSSDSPQSPKKNDTSDKKTSESGTGAGPQKKIGHLGIKKEDQIWSRAVLMTGVLVIVIVMKWRKTNEITWASRQDVLTKAKAQPLICSTPYFDELKQFEGTLVFFCNQCYLNILTCFSLQVVRLSSVVALWWMVYFLKTKSILCWVFFRKDWSLVLHQVEQVSSTYTQGPCQKGRDSSMYIVTQKQETFGLMLKWLHTCELFFFKIMI